MYSVYALCDPRTGDIRYIGSSKNIHRRYAEHLLYAEGAKKAWLEELLQQQKLPTLIIIESDLAEQQILDREMYWIAYYAKRGDKLINRTGIQGKQTDRTEKYKRQRRELSAQVKAMRTYIAHSEEEAERLRSEGKKAEVLYVETDDGQYDTLAYRNGRLVGIKSPEFYE